MQKAQYFEGLKANVGWRYAVEHMTALVDASLEDMQKNVSPDEKLALRLQMRWQQRGYMKDTLLAHIDEVIAVKNELLERAKEPEDVNADSYTAY